jgi:hypothetical protein
MIVPIPPTEAARGTPRRRAFVNVDFRPRFVSRGVTAATTMAVVAVLDMSIEATIVVNISPLSSLFGVAPETRRVNFRRSASNPVFVNAVARKNPPIMSQMTLLENVFAYFPIS